MFASAGTTKSESILQAVAKRRAGCDSRPGPYRRVVGSCDRRPRCDIIPQTLLALQSSGIHRRCVLTRHRASRRPGGSDESVATPAPHGFLEGTDQMLPPRMVRAPLQVV
jgi:hypothetical protein